MKKIMLVFAAVVLTLISCSSDDNNAAVTPLNTNGTIIKKIISNSGSSIYTSEYFYVGNKLSKIVSSGGTTIPDMGIYTYMGDVVTKIDNYRSNALVSTSNIHYNEQGQIADYVLLNFPDNKGYRVTYDHNTDGTIEIHTYTGDFETQITEKDHKRAYFENGKLTRIETYEIISGNPETLTTIYNFDDKHDPRNAILGFDKLTFYDLGAYNVPNNVTAYIYSATNTTETDTDEVHYTYNSYGFPITSNAIDLFDNGGPDIVTQYFYY